MSVPRRVPAPYQGHATLALATGEVFRGYAFGARATVVGEVVFNTAMTGYQEIVSDPSYAGQLECLTVAEVGNVGCNPDDDESQGRAAEGLIVRSLAPSVSNWRAQQSLGDFLAARKVPGIGEIDTRALTRTIRRRGAVTGALSTDGRAAEELVARAREQPNMEGQALGLEVGTSKVYEWTEPTWANLPVQSANDAHVVVIDFGVKRNILRHLRNQGLRVSVVPAKSCAGDVLALHPDGLLLSNGPGDPHALTEVIANLRELFHLAPQLPVFGICLGHQLMCLALGGRTYKLKFGHHGGNHPVRVDASGQIEITSQNHGFAVESDSLGDGASLSHINLFDRTVAGLRFGARPLFGVQYHPEAAPGPHDSEHLFASFARLLRESKARAAI
jgi:carbamoyl-phosphate synthase small subunit